LKKSLNHGLNGGNGFRGTRGTRFGAKKTETRKKGEKEKAESQPMHPKKWCGGVMFRSILSILLPASVSSLRFLFELCVEKNGAVAEHLVYPSNPGHPCSCPRIFPNKFSCLSPPIRLIEQGVATHCLIQGATAPCSMRKTQAEIWHPSLET